MSPAARPACPRHHRQVPTHAQRIQDQPGGGIGGKTEVTGRRREVVLQDLSVDRLRLQVSVERRKRISPPMSRVVTKKRSAVGHHGPPAGPGGVGRGPPERMAETVAAMSRRSMSRRRSRARPGHRPKANVRCQAERLGLRLSPSHGRTNDEQKARRSPGRPSRVSVEALPRWPWRSSGSTLNVAD